MAEIGFSITEKLIEVLASQSIKKICELWNYESQLEKLKETVSFIQKVFLDADAKWDQLSEQDRHYISELKDVVYDADDVFDEFRTRAELNQLGKKSKVRKFFGKVRAIFSPDMNQNQVYYAHRVSRDVKVIKERLDAIAIDHKKFELKIDNQPLILRREETCSYIDANQIIGRDEDLKKIIDMLLSGDPHQRVSFLSIVGVGGVGKTALAQLVFNHEKIKQEFSDYRKWVCVADQEGEGQQFDVKSILSRLIDVKLDGTSTFEAVQSEFQKKYGEKKYFLVLDDVWNERREKWLDLKKFLTLGHKGSKVLVTTRSEMTATVIGDGNYHTYRLKGLLEEDSWCLFELSAFTSGDMKDNHDQLVEIGKKIVEKCYHIPLAIKVVGSLLFGQEISKWRLLEESGLAKVSEAETGILHVLKLSYHNLKPSSKSCFSYCALFPKDFEILKKEIIGLWMAQGFIVLDGCQNLEDVAEEHFSILLRRCFFQDVERDAWGDVMSFKLHDLMHNVAQKVGEEEICIRTSVTSTIGGRVRHVYDAEGCLEHSLKNKNIRSLLGSTKYFLNAKINNWMRLRVLKLSSLRLEILPDSIGKLLHLRYLDLSRNDFEVLGESITDLYNLQTLDLSWCIKLRELPKAVSKLVNLRHLNIKDSMLTCMPLGMEKLTNLRDLSQFVVGRKIVAKEQLNGDGMLKDLKALHNIRGFMRIVIGKNYKNVEDVNGDGGYVKSMKDLWALTIECDSVDDDDNNDWAEQEDLLDKLEPPQSLKALCLKHYKGKRIGRVVDNWIVPLSLLVTIEILWCPNLEQMPILSKLPRLKSLVLKGLQRMEYMEIGISSNSNVGDTVEATEVFPSLETLVIVNLTRWKQWWKGGFPQMTRLRFPHLYELRLHHCPNMISFALDANLESLTELELPVLHLLEIWKCPNMALNLVCPSLEKLELKETSERLQITCGNRKDTVFTMGSVIIDKVSYLKSLSVNYPAHLYICDDEEVETLSDVNETFKGAASSFQILEIRGCKKLKGLLGLEHLTALKDLTLYDNKELSICEEDDEEPWKSLSSSLLNLTFSDLPELKSLPKGMQYLTSLQSLKLEHCINLKGGLPEWISCLSSLKFLRIVNCPGIKSFPEAIKDLTSLEQLTLYKCPDLEDRCKTPNGEDFSKIQHIPKIGFELWLW